MTTNAPTNTVTVTAAHIETALRKWLAIFDYDTHKNLECSEDDGADHYPEEAASLFGHLSKTAHEQTPRPLLTASEREFLEHALELVAERMQSRSNEYTVRDEESLAFLRRLAGGEQP